MTTVVACPRDPGVETALRCSRCDTPICPRCMVQTPVGARCKPCARIVKSPVYVLNGTNALKAAGVALVGGVVIGLVWGLILAQVAVGFLSFFLGAGLGYVFVRMLDFATRRKRGPAVIGFAVAGILIAWGIQFAIVPHQAIAFSLVAVGVGIYFAYQELK
ncbi:MAG: hypothetical protein LC118_05385 [Dehalococcoidia bacterium]|nr:hypothetical protein [Dehalococcoidia bacterium]